MNNETIKAGEAAVQRIIALCKTHGIQVSNVSPQTSDNPKPERDLILSPLGVPQWVEIKNEDNYAHSRNICIERVQNQKDPRFSGILTSESQVCIHTLGAQVALYRTQYMRIHIASELRSKRLKEDYFRGADNGNRGLVIPYMSLLSHTWFDLRPFSELFESRVWEYRYIVYRLKKAV